MLSITHPRPLWLSIALIYSALSLLLNLGGLQSYAYLPEIDRGTAMLIGTLALASFVCWALAFVSLWQMKKWGMWFFAVASAIGVATSVIFGLTPH